MTKPLYGRTYHDGMVTIQFCEICGIYLGANYPSYFCDQHQEDRTIRFVASVSGIILDVRG